MKMYEISSDHFHDRILTKLPELTGDSLAKSYTRLTNRRDNEVMQRVYLPALVSGPAFSDVYREDSTD